MSIERLVINYAAKLNKIQDISLGIILENY